MVHHDRCPLCSSEMINVHFVCIDHFISKESHLPLPVATDADFCLLRIIPAENEIYRYYESDNYISHSDTSEGIINKIYHLIRQLMLVRKRRIIKQADRPEEW